MPGALRDGSAPASSPRASHPPSTSITRTPGSSSITSRASPITSGRASMCLSPRSRNRRSARSCGGFSWPASIGGSEMTDPAPLLPALPDSSETKVATSARPAPSMLPIEGPSAWVGAECAGVRRSGPRMPREANTSLGCRVAAAAHRRRLDRVQRLPWPSRLAFRLPTPVAAFPKSVRSGLPQLYAGQSLAIGRNLLERDAGYAARLQHQPAQARY
jgi:hypothetical protein